MTTLERPRIIIPPADRLSTMPEGLPELTLGWEAAGWAMEYLKQPNGPKAQQFWRPVDSQLKFLLWWYAVDTNGRWLYHHGVRRLVKGSGKSPFAAVLALMEFLGPVRLKDFDPKLPGGCKGKAVDMPLVQIAATAESQTANTMRMVRAMAPRHSKVAVKYGLDVGLTRYYKAPEGTLEIITSSAGAAEGAESSFNVWDETEHWTPNKSGPALAATLDDNLTKSGSRSMETCNAWVPGVESVAEAAWEAWILQEENKTRGTSKILYDALIAPPDTDMNKPESLQKALEHCYGDCFWADLEPIKQKIWDPRSNVDASKRKYLNWPTVSLGTWVTPQAWSQIRDSERVVELGEEIVLFFDGSVSKDATALVGCCVSDGHVFVIGAWEPNMQEDRILQAKKSADERYRVPVHEVDATVARAFREYNPVAFYADVREWESFAKVSWPELYADRLKMWAFKDGKDPQAIAWDMRTKVAPFTFACELVLQEIKEKTFTQDGDSRLARHVANCRDDMNRWGVSVAKESPDSPKKIDLAVAMIGARMVRRLYISDEGRQKPPRSGRVW